MVLEAKVMSKKALTFPAMFLTFIDADDENTRFRSYVSGYWVSDVKNMNGDGGG